MIKASDYIFARDGKHHTLVRASSGSYFLTYTEAWEMGQCESDSRVLCVAYILEGAKTTEEAVRDLRAKGFRMKERGELPF